MNTTNESVRVLDGYILVKQVMKKKKTIISVDMASSEKDKFDFSFEIVQVPDGSQRGVNVGEHPIFSEYVKFSGLKMIERNDLGMVSLVIVHENDIIAIDYEAETLDISMGKEPGKIINN